jgi:lysophospholipid acyltransferase (LPLAT)-like uncharacterized protein
MTTDRVPLRRRWRRARRSLGKVLMRLFGARLMRWNAATWKVEVENEHLLEEARGGGGGLFIAIWHGRMLLGMARYSGLGWTVLVSRSGDGDVSDALLRSLGYGVIRGSSSKGGASAVRGMLAALRRGEVLVITPDGPRGPMHSTNPGLAWMSRATGHAILPLGLAAEPAWRLRSWDRFTIPRPGARVALVYGEPMRVPRDADEAAQLAATEELRERMLECERRASERLGLEPDD